MERILSLYGELLLRAMGQTLLLALMVANTYMSFQTWTIVAVMYLVVITALSRVAKALERRLNRGR